MAYCVVQGGVCVIKPTASSVMYISVYYASVFNYKITNHTFTCPCICVPETILQIRKQLKRWIPLPLICLLRFYWLPLSAPQKIKTMAKGCCRKLPPQAFLSPAASHPGVINSSPPPPPITTISSSEERLVASEQFREQLLESWCQMASILKCGCGRRCGKHWCV